MAGVPCPFAPFGCPEKKVPPGRLEAHLEAGAADHLNLVCVELVHQRNAGRAQLRAAEQDWARELAALQAAAKARETELEAQLAELRQGLAAQTSTVARLLAGSVLVVDRQGAGLFTTVGAALRVCRPGDTIVVRGGEYHEAVTVVQPDVTVRGTEAPPTVLRGAAPSAVLTLCCAATVMGLRIEQDHPGHPAVSITAGAPTLEQCDVTGLERPVVVVEPSAAPTLRQCHLHNTQEAGVSFRPGSHGTLMGCRVFGCGGPNVEVLAGADVIVQDCKLFDSRDCALVITEAPGRFERNEIYHAMGHNVSIVSGSPQLVENHIHSAQQCGISIEGVGARPTIERNEVDGNNGANVVVGPAAAPILANNTIHHSRQHGVVLRAGAAGELRDNTIHGNIGLPVHAEAGVKTRGAPFPATSKR